MIGFDTNTLCHFILVGMLLKLPVFPTDNLTMNGKNIFKFLLFTLCLAGFSYHVTDISIEYFAYKTNTKTFVSLNSRFENPSIVLCIRYMDIFDRSRHPRLRQRFSNESEEEYEDDMKKLTVSDIFAMTPHPSQVMNSCDFREDDHGAAEHNASECEKLFHVNKYEVGRYVCYQFLTKVRDSQFDCNNFSFSLTYANVMYAVTLNHSFSNANFIRVMSFVPSHYEEDHLSEKIIPASSRRFYGFLLRYPRGLKEKSTKRYIAVSGDMIKINRMESPYDTKCTKNKKLSREACVRNCNFKIFYEYNMTPPNEFIFDDKLNIRGFSMRDYENRTLVRQIERKVLFCSEKCTRDLCSELISVTRVDTRPYLYENGSFTVASFCSKSPSVFITFEPTINFYEFVIYLSSCCGIWFGISVRSLTSCPLCISSQHFPPRKLQTDQIFRQNRPFVRTSDNRDKIQNTKR